MNPLAPIQVSHTNIASLLALLYSKHTWQLKNLDVTPFDYVNTEKEEKKRLECSRWINHHKLAIY